MPKEKEMIAKAEPLKKFFDLVGTDEMKCCLKAKSAFNLGTVEKNKHKNEAMVINDLQLNNIIQHLIFKLSPLLHGKLLNIVSSVPRRKHSKTLDQAIYKYYYGQNEDFENNRNNNNTKNRKKVCEDDDDDDDNLPENQKPKKRKKGIKPKSIENNNNVDNNVNKNVDNIIDDNVIKNEEQVENNVDVDGIVVKTEDIDKEFIYEANPEANQ